MAKQDKARTGNWGILGGGASGSWPIYGSVLPLYREPDSGNWGLSGRGYLNDIAGIPQALKGILGGLYSGVTYPGDVYGGRASPQDTKRLMDFLSIPMMGMDIGSPFSGTPLRGGIAGQYVSTMAAEDYARASRALSDMLGWTTPEGKDKPKPNGKTILEA